MQRFIKGRTTQHLTWVMVDATDFATPESALSAAMKIKIFGKVRANDTVQFVSSGTGSLANDIKHVGPSVLGIYTIGLTKADLSDASAAWYDQYIISLSATGAAYQVLVIDGGIDESALSGYQSRLSDLQSALLVVQSMASDAQSAAVQANSRVLLVLSNVSDVQSALTVVQSMASDAASAAQQGNSRLLLNQSVLSDILSQCLVIASMASDAASAAQQGSSRILVVQSLVSDVDSALTSRFSNLESLLTTTGVQVNASSLSDLRSAIAAITATLSTSDISDIASAVRAALVSDLSDILSAAQQTNSRVLVVQSLVSDVDSALTSRFSNLESLVTTTGVQLNASTLSDLRSAVAGVTATLGASDISDIASAVRAILVSDLSDILSAAQQANSRILVVQSLVSDVDSALTSRFSDLLSVVGTTGVQLNASTLSDLRSAITAYALSASDMSDIASRVDVVLASRLSDILSAAQQTNSRVLVTQSMVSDTQSKLSDVESNLLSFLTTTGVQLNASVLSDLRSAVAAVTVNLTASDISDIASAVAAAVTTVTASDISDIASRVDAVLASRLSDILSAAQQANSRVLAVQSQASDVYSLLSDLQSDFQSRVPKRIATDSQVSALASDVLSALAAGVPVAASDMSDLRSAIAAGVLTASDISDIASAVAVKLASDLSDLYSAVQQTSSRALVNQSRVSDIYSLLGDVYSDLTVLSGVVSDVTSAVGALPTAAQTADKVLGRNLAGGADGGRTVTDALRVSRNKVVIDGSSITVYAEDDTTIAWSGTVTRAELDTLQSVDPA